MLQPQDEYAIAKRWREHNDGTAAQTLVTSHLRLVAATDMLANLTLRFHDFGSNAPAMALKEMSLMARLQASVMSFADMFLLLTMLLFALAALRIVMKRPAALADAAGGAH